MVWGLLIAALMLFYGIHSLVINNVAQTQKGYCEYWLRSDPDDPIPYFAMADEYLAQENYPQALVLYQKFRDSCSCSRDLVYEKLGTVYLRMGNVAKAREYFSKSVQEGKTETASRMLGVLDSLEALPKQTNGSHLYKCTLTASGKMSCSPALDQ